MIIRKTTINDISVLEKLFESAREYMIEQGNPTQWTNGYPDIDTIKIDIEKSKSYVCVDDYGIILATFVFYIGIEEDYKNIEDGSWINDNEYGVIHRLASNRSKKGIASFCLNWCYNKINNIREDTHKDNIPMQKLLEKEGYTQCGIITLKRSGDKRIAFQKV